MNLHQYRVLRAMAAKPTTTAEEREALEAALNRSYRGFCYKCKRMSFSVMIDESRGDIELKHMCRECADKGE